MASAGQPSPDRSSRDAVSHAAGAPVTLVKGEHRWTFACEPGDEPALLGRLSELARGQDVPFDWFDAALVSHQLRKRLKPGLFRIDGQNRTEKN